MVDKQHSDKKSSPTQSNTAALYDLRSAIAHELRTPLTSIVGYAQALLADSTLEEETREKIATILRTEQERLNRTVDEVLRAAVPHMAHTDDSLSDSDPASVLAMVARFASQRFPTKTFCVSYALAPGTTFPAMNSGELFSVTFYLISLIAHLTYDHLPITLSVESLSQRPFVTVRCRFNTYLFENGSAADAPRFEPKLATGHLREEEIAQTIVHRVTEYYGGVVHANMFDDGQTVFKIGFPA